MLPAAALLALAACGSGGGQSAASAKQEITTTWEAFFSPTSSNVSQLQDGTKLQAVYQAGRSNPATQTLMAKVKAVTLSSNSDCKTSLVPSPCAKVTFDLLANGAPVLPNSSGYATKQNGKWRVSKATFCGLIALGNGGQAPPGC